MYLNHCSLKVFRNKKIAYAQNKAQNKQQYKDDIKKESYENASKDYDYSDSIAENVFKGFRDDLDFNDENDVGMLILLVIYIYHTLYPISEG